jgi:molecular chaperone DnaK
MQTEINLPFITADASGPKHLNLSLTRSKLEQLTEDLVERSIGPCRMALKDKSLGSSDIDEVILVGGMTRMPAVQEAVRKFFGRDPHKGVNPDEVVAAGAAIQAGIISGEVKDIVLVDVTPLTLSIETLGGVATALIERNSNIPKRKSQVFSTASDSQAEVEIHVVQGDRPFAADNKSLGKFTLDGIPPAPRGIPQIEVTFDINRDGILNVSALDKATGRSQHITVSASSGLSEQEVEKLRKEAETHADEDRKRRDLVEARNKADNAIYAAEKALRESGDKVSQVVQDRVKSKIEALHQAVDTPTLESLRQTTTDLLTTIQEVGMAAYQGGEDKRAGGTGPRQEGGTGPGQAGGTGPRQADGTRPQGPPSGDVVDGEFKEA